MTLDDDVQINHYLSIINQICENNRFPEKVAFELVAR